MRFMTLWRPGTHAHQPDEKVGAQMGKLIEEMNAAGVMVATGGWDPTGPCTMLRASKDGGMTVTDGPFAEAKEVVAGFAIMDVKSKAEAIAWCRRFLEIAGEGTSEMRELFGGLKGQ